MSQQKRIPPLPAAGLRPFKQIILKVEVVRDTKRFSTAVPTFRHSSVGFASEDGKQRGFVAAADNCGLLIYDAVADAYYAVGPKDIWEAFQSTSEVTPSSP